MLNNKCLVNILLEPFESLYVCDFLYARLHGKSYWTIYLNFLYIWEVIFGLFEDKVNSNIFSTRRHQTVCVHHLGYFLHLQVSFLSSFFIPDSFSMQLQHGHSFRNIYVLDAWIWWKIIMDHRNLLYMIEHVFGIRRRTLKHL
jgi:hypothetical protein